MTFNDIAWKNFKANVNKYKFYFLCNSFTILLLFMFSALLFNEELLSATEVVQEIILIPTVVLVVFAIFFVSYAHTTFVVGRKKEFGLLLSLGMSIKEIRKLILVENSLIAGASLLAGLVGGSIFSRLFFLVILRLIDVTDVSFQLSFMSYVFSAGLFLVVFLVAMAATLLSAGKLEVIQLLKVGRTAQLHKVRRPWLGFAGITLLVGALVYFAIHFYEDPLRDGAILLLTTIAVIIGLYLSFTQLGSVLLASVKGRPSVYFSRLLFFSSMNHKFKGFANINFLIALLVFVMMFYSSHVLHLYLATEKTVVEANPFDIAYVEVAGKNQLSDAELTALMEEAGSPILEHLKLEIVNVYDEARFNERYIFLSDKQVASVGGEAWGDMEVTPGNYVLLAQLPMQMEWDDQRRFIDDYRLPVGGALSLRFQEAVFDRLFNDINYNYRHFYVLHHEEFEGLRGSVGKDEVARLHLVNVENWKESEAAVASLTEKLAAANEGTPLMDISLVGRALTEEVMLQPASRIQAYTYGRQSSGIIFYLFVFMGALFFAATCIILYLRMFTHMEEEREKFRKLFRIGFTEGELRRSIAGELRLQFFAAPLTGIFIAFVYILVFYKEAGQYLDILLSSAVIVGAYLVFQLIYYFFAKEKYYRGIVDGM